MSAPTTTSNPIHDQPRPVTIGIAGGTGSGKTTVSRELRARVGTELVYLAHDSYYKDWADLPIVDDWPNFDHPTRSIPR